MGATYINAKTQIGHFYRLSDGRHLRATLLMSYGGGVFSEALDSTHFGKGRLALEQIKYLDEVPEKEVKTFEEAEKIWPGLKRED